jgi:hypothetical protein
VGTAERRSSYKSSIPDRASIPSSVLMPRIWKTRSFVERLSKKALVMLLRHTVTAQLTVTVSGVRVRQAISNCNGDRECVEHNARPQVRIASWIGSYVRVLPQPSRLVETTPTHPVPISSHLNPPVSVGWVELWVGPARAASRGRRLPVTRQSGYEALERSHVSEARLGRPSLWSNAIHAERDPDCRDAPT